MQNKLHFAATGMTAAELIATRADHALPNMGLTSWKGGRVAKADVRIAKNYLSGDEIGELNRIVVMWLDFAEDQARRRKQVFLVPTPPGLRILFQKPWPAIRSSEISPRRPGS